MFILKTFTTITGGKITKQVLVFINDIFYFSLDLKTFPLSLYRKKKCFFFACCNSLIVTFRYSHYNNHYFNLQTAESTIRQF